MIWIGLDLSSVATGVGIIETGRGDSVTFLATRIIKIKRTDTMLQKLRTLHQRLQVIVDYYYSVNKEVNLCIEEPFLYKNPKTYGVLSQCFGVAVIVGLKCKETYSYPPLKVRSLIGNAKLKKEGVAEQVALFLKNADEYKKRKVSLDESDALAVALAAYFSNR